MDATAVKAQIRDAPLNLLIKSPGKELESQEEAAN
jgi:hypothetical protein